jgi:hypothetical protein
MGRPPDEPFFDPSIEDWRSDFCDPIFVHRARVGTWLDLPPSLQVPYICRVYRLCSTRTLLYHVPRRMVANAALRACQAAMGGLVPVTLGQSRQLAIV